MSVEALEAMPTAPLDTLSSGDSRGMVTLYRADMQMLIEGMQRMEAEFQEERRRREEACEALAKMDALLEARDRELQKLSGAVSASSATDLRRYVRELEEMVDGLEGERAHLAGALAQRERQILEAAAENNSLQASLRAAEERCVALEEGRMLLANLIDLASLPSSPPAQPDTDSYPSAEDDDGWHHHHHHQGGARVEVGGRRRGRRFSFPTCDAVEPEKKMVMDDDDDTLDYEVIVDELLQENKAQRQLRREDASIKQRLREELGAAREELQCLRAEASQGRALIADLRNAMQAVGGSAAVILAQPPQRARRAGPSQVLPLDLSSVVAGRSAATAALVDDALSTGSSRRHSGLRAFSGSARGARVTPRLSSRSPDGSTTCDLSSAAAAAGSSGRRRRRSSHGAVPVAPVAVSPPSASAAARCDESPSPVALGRIDLVDAGRHKLHSAPGGCGGSKYVAYVKRRQCSASPLRIGVSAHAARAQCGGDQQQSALRAVRIRRSRVPVDACSTLSKG
ncbi:hypothetical protein JKP88DRAFT_275664 [Tribonema minus]|uniref:Uncharacterized protein n=1 Tax=Tribonema minus TaxID=303371 RepID=A0A835ZDQ1_9STRA|nr:hypothetical protein JKP88DRAFT_275664 [Tribonema minus]